MFSTAVWERGGVILAGRPQGRLLVEVICLRSGVAGKKAESERVHDGRLDKTLVISMALKGL